MLVNGSNFAIETDLGSRSAIFTGLNLKNVANTLYL